MFMIFLQVITCLLPENIHAASLHERSMNQCTIVQVKLRTKKEVNLRTCESMYMWIIKKIHTCESMYMWTIKKLCTWYSIHIK